jgi:acetolactate decarboxylase
MNKTQISFLNKAASVASLLLAFSAVPLQAQTTHNTKQISSSVSSKADSTLFQYSTLPALSIGIYDGDLTFGQLLRYGNFGLGTLQGLDGEVMILDGQAWQARSDGEVLPVSPQRSTPFAVVTHFNPERRWKLSPPTEYSKLKTRLAQLLPNTNAPCAIRIRGTFPMLKVRSVPRQQKPYPVLADVVKTQSEWTLKNVRGTLVGFWFPTYMSNLNLADFHFHFLSDDHKRGGHVLDAQLRDAIIEMQVQRSFQLQLPQSHDFANADLTADQKEALHKAESGSTQQGSK